MNMASRLTRSRTDRWLFGVCGGIAEQMDVAPGWVRLAVLAGSLFGIPILLPYIIAAVVIPEGQKAISGAAPSAVDWGEDHLRVAVSGPLIPYTWSWKQWATGWGVLGAMSVFLFLLVTAGTALASALIGAADPAILTLIAGVFSTIPMVATTALIISLGAAIAPLRYTLTCTHVSMWIQGPLTRPRRVELSLIESLRKKGSHLELRLTDGEMVQLPKPETSDELDILLGVIDDARRRAGEHARDLAAEVAERERLQRLMTSRSWQRD